MRSEQLADDANQRHVLMRTPVGRGSESQKLLERPGHPCSRPDKRHRAWCACAGRLRGRRRGHASAKGERLPFAPRHWRHPWPRPRCSAACGCGRSRDCAPSGAERPAALPGGGASAGIRLQRPWIRPRSAWPTKAQLRRRRSANSQVKPGIIAGLRPTHDRAGEWVQFEG